MKSRQADAKRESNLTELITAIREGDQQAFTELYEMTSQEVYRTARAVLRDEEAALDVQQDTYVFAYNHLDQLSDPEKVRPWLRAIAVNRAKSVLRRQTPILFTELENEEGEGLPEQADLSPEGSPELSLERKETSELVNEILEELSDGQRAAVAMYYYEQMSIGEISEALGVAPGTVKAQLARGRKKIEEAVHRLEKQGVKLYGLSPIPFLLALMKRQLPAAQAGEAVLTKTLAQTGLAAGAKAAITAGSGAAAAPLAEAVVLHATRPFFTTALGKLVLGVICAGVVGGGVAGYRWAKHAMEEKTTPILTMETREDPQPDPTGPTLPVELDVPAVPETEAESGEDDQKLWGTCGEDLQWTLFKNSGKLVLKGSGAMTDYPDVQSVPWSAYQGSIQELELPEQLSAIGDYAFANCTQLDPTYVTTGSEKRQLPSGLTRIGNYAFSGCTKLDLSWYTDWLPTSLTSIGDGAFANCTALRQIILPQNLGAIGSGALRGCSNLSQLWIMSESCALPADLCDLSQLTVCGFPGSTAEQYAAEAGVSFNPVEDNQAGVSEKLEQEQQINAHFTRMETMFQIGDRYLAKVVTTDLLKASEAEISQARQSGTLSLDGAEYPFTDSKTQAKLWGYVYDASEDAEGWVGWIQANGSVYSVLWQDGGYVFWENQQTGSGDPYLKQSDYTDIGWIWLDGDTMTSYGKLSDYLKETTAENICLNFFLELDDDGEISIVKISSGWK
ncbi:MAG: sigma-70 family RNA polymerase sigma factor [Oscillospiraceae bacterium]|nr:sigma-70 family RNA polymerase sigma factor [Oscillospiraceae bacterium]